MKQPTSLIVSRQSSIPRSLAKLRQIMMDVDMRKVFDCHGCHPRLGDVFVAPAPMISLLFRNSCCRCFIPTPSTYMHIDLSLPLLFLLLCLCFCLLLLFIPFSHPAAVYTFFTSSCCCPRQCRWSMGRSRSIDYTDPLICHTRGPHSAGRQVKCRGPGEVQGAR